MYMMQDYTLLEKKLNYTFKDKKHLDIAFTHKSFANECLTKKIPSYERYEFLGDAILEFLSSKVLFERYPEKGEGELSKLRSSLVCEYTLSKISKELGLGEYLYLSHGEAQTGGKDRPSILCDIFESVLGAIYLDGGTVPAAKYVNEFLLTDIEQKTLFFDAKSTLQEYAQKNGKVLSYEIINESGPDHNKIYTAQALLDNVPQAAGEGHNIKTAEQVAAHETLIKLGIKNI